MISYSGLSSTSRIRLMCPLIDLFRQILDRIGGGGFTPSELRKLKSLKPPAGIQRFLDGIPSPLADTAWPPRQVLAEKSAHCLEGAIFAAAALRVNGFPPLI